MQGLPDVLGLRQRPLTLSLSPRPGRGDAVPASGGSGGGASTSMRSSSAKLSFALDSAIAEVTRLYARWEQLQQLAAGK